MNTKLFFGIITGMIFFSGIFMSPVFAQTVSAPDAITDLIAIPKDGEVQLSWTAPANNGATITSYKIIRWETGSDVFTTFPNLSTVTSAVATGLKNGVSYSFKVQAVNSIGAGPDSNVASSTPNTSLASKNVPDAITDLKVTRDDGLVHVTWSKPNDNGSKITGYKITFWQVGTNDFHSKTIDVTSTTTRITGLINEIPYVFKINAINAVGTSPDSNLDSVTPSAIVKATVPGEVRGVNAIPSNSQVFLTWIEPSSNGSPITGYKITVSEKGSNVFTTIPGVGDSTKTTISGLKNNISYEFKVSAVNAVGTGKTSKIITATPNSSVPIVITNLKATPGDGKVSLSWTVSSSTLDSISGYRIREYRTGSDTFTTHSVIGKSTTITIDGLTNGISYGFMVLGVNIDGIGPESKIVTATPVGKASTSSLSLPAWIKNSAKWWSEGKISDLEYVQGIEYLINQGIIKIK